MSAADTQHNIQWETTSRKLVLCLHAIEELSKVEPRTRAIERRLMLAQELVRIYTVRLKNEKLEIN